jgi:hypothetical protein
VTVRRLARYGLSAPVFDQIMTTPQPVLFPAPNSTGTRADPV